MLPKSKNNDPHTYTSNSSFNTDQKNLITGIPSWKKDINLSFTGMNEPALKLFSFEDVDDAVGKNDHNIKSEIQRFSDLCIDGDKKVILSEKNIKFIEIHTIGEKSKQELKIFFVEKSPIFLEKSIVGVSGYCVELPNNFLKMGLTLMNKDKKYEKSIEGKYLDKKYIVGGISGGINLSSRQHECLHFLIRGKTLREISKILNISPRTVEIHMEKLKLKFNCTSKSELISAAIEYGFINIIPERFINQKFLLEI